MGIVREGENDSGRESKLKRKVSYVSFRLLKEEFQEIIDSVAIRKHHCITLGGMISSVITDDSNISLISNSMYCTKQFSYGYK